jgi:hypothetical protein
MPDLTDKQRLFVAKYPVDFNATQEALRAGYGPKTARFIGAGSVCSNRAATQANNLKTRAKLRSENSGICRNFASFRNLRKTVALLLQGGGRWFEPSIAHFEKVSFAGEM